MNPTLNRILLAAAAAITLLDGVWLAAGHFQIDARNYALLFFVMLPLVGTAWYYGAVRREEAIATTLTGIGFLIVFPAGCSLLSYLLMTIAGPRIDVALAAIDHAMGFSWPALMGLAARHRILNTLLAWAYVSVMPQTTLLLLLLGWKNKCADIYGLCLALAGGAAITLALWTMFPSFGAFSVFILPPGIASKLGLVVGFDYARDLVAMLRHGPGFISPTELRGVVGFPSYHTVQALVLIWYARHLKGLRWVALGLNIAVLAATPIQGGHHLIDLIGGAVVALCAIALAERTVSWARGRSTPDTATLSDGYPAR
jgi:hypothetical protein